MTALKSSQMTRAMSSCRESSLPAQRTACWGRGVCVALTEVQVVQQIKRSTSIWTQPKPAWVDRKLWASIFIYHTKVFNFTCPNFFPTSHVLTLQSEINRQKSPMLNRRRASITTLARTVPNIVPQSPGATSPVQSPTDMYRYMKNDDSHRQRNDCSRWV